MAENVEQNTPAEDPIPQVVEYTDTQKTAMEQGWVPEDQWTGSGRWRSAEDFLDRGELFSKIDEVKRRAERAERTLEDLKKHHSKVRDVEFKRAIAHLRSEKAAAVEAGDGERVVEIDEEIDKTKEAQREVEAQVDEPEVTPNPAFQTWVSRNGWYTSDKVLKSYADEVAQRLVAAGERDHKTILQEVERRVKKEYSDKFVNPNRERPGSVETGGNKGSGGRRDDFQLTPEETQVMSRFVKAKVMTKEEYIAEIKAARKGA